MSSQGSGRSWRASSVLVAIAAVLATVSGCGFANALAHPASVPVVSSDDPAADSAAPATPSDRVIAAADLRRGDVVTGHLAVTAGPVRTGLAPPVMNFSVDCPVDGKSLQYVAIGITYTTPDGDPLSGLAGHLTVRTGAATPAGIGDVGVFFESMDGDERYCAHYPPLPTTDTFYNHAGPQTVYGYVVLDRAVTPTTPQGRPEVFPTLQLELSHLRWFADYSSTADARTPAAPSAGTTCPGDPTALCMQLG